MAISRSATIANVSSNATARAQPTHCIRRRSVAPARRYRLLAAGSPMTAAAAASNTIGQSFGPEASCGATSPTSAPTA